MLLQASRPRVLRARWPSDHPKNFSRNFAGGEKFLGLAESKGQSGNPATRHRLERQSPRWHPPGPTNECLAPKSPFLKVTKGLLTRGEECRWGSHVFRVPEKVPALCWYGRHFL